jgi:PEP-CTERM motif
VAVFIAAFPVGEMFMRMFPSILAAMLTIGVSVIPAYATFIVGAHSSEKGNANFSFGGDTSSASTSIASGAVGLIGTNSIFGGNGSANDVYVFSYTPGADADNTVFAAATVLGDSSATDVDGAGPTAPVYANVPQLASGLVGGRTGLYKVYFTTPASTGVNGTTLFETTGELGTVALNPVNMNTGGTGTGNGANNAWLHIATVPLTAGNTYSVTMTSSGNAFVSQRAHAVMWEYIGPSVPEPATLVLAALASIGSLAPRRRRTL